MPISMNPETEISIHTTTQVVTCPGPNHLAFTLDFNPHHHAGGDWAEAVMLNRMTQISIHTTTQVVT